MLPLSRSSRFAGFVLVALASSFARFRADASEAPPTPPAPPLQLADLPRLPEPEVMDAAEEAAQAVQRLRLPAGLTAGLWAAEPMLVNPVAINFDHRGRLFVAETHRYGSSVLDIRAYMAMLEEDLAARTIEDRMALIHRQFGAEGAQQLAIEGELVRLLEDRDGDGTADFSTVYADGFNTALDGVASGVLLWRDGVFFTNIPSLWHFTGEERAETRVELSRGYGVRFGYTGHDLHGLAWGPDGKLYFSVGDRGAHITLPDGRVVSSPDTGAVFRCNADGTDLEIVHTGLRNPQDLIFTENGDLFTGDNDSDQGDMERLVQIVEGGDSGWRVGYQFAPLGRAGPWNLENIWTPRHPRQPANILPPLCNIEDGPSGMAYNPGTALTPESRGKLLITHFKGTVARSGVFTYTLEPAGATYRAVASEELVGQALPTDITFGPDGRLYFSDWADGWPKSRRGRIYVIDDPARRDDPLRRETQQLIRDGMRGRPADALARLLGHADQRVRLDAQFELAERGAASVPAFAAVVTKSDAPPLGRLHALWGLGQLARRDVAPAVLAVRPLLADTDAGMRAQAARILGDVRDQTSAEPLLARLEDESARVRFFAAQSLGKLAQPQFTPPLLAALRANDDADPYLRHALVMGLAGANHLPALTEAIADPSRAVRLGVLLALRRLGRVEVARFLEDSDPFLVAEAARAINDEPIVAAYPALAAFVARPRADETFTLRALNAAFRLGGDEHAALLAAFATRAEALPRTRTEALRLLALWPRPPARDHIVGIFRPLNPPTRDARSAAAALNGMLPVLLMPDAPANVQEATFAAIRALDVRAAADELFAAVADEQRTGATRVAALQALDHFSDPRLAEAVALAGNSSSSELRLAALAVAAKLSPEATIPVLEGLAQNGRMNEQRTAYAALGDLAHPAADRILAARLEALAADAVPVGAQLELLEAAAKRIDPAIVTALTAREAALTAATDPLARHRSALEGGQVRSGRDVFNDHPVFACIRCHVVDGRGGEVGPDLSEIATRMNREQLLDAVINPNATIAPGFEAIGVTLRSGDVHVGIVASETDTTLSLRLADNSLVEIARSDIASREGAPSSMPAIYGQVLTPRELRDLVSYLASLRTPPPTRAAPGPRALLPAPEPETDPESDEP